MKKIVCLSLICLLLIFAAGGASATEPVLSLKALDIWQADYNPFAGLLLPAGYTLTSIDAGLDTDLMYSICIRTNDTIESVMPFVIALLPNADSFDAVSEINDFIANGSTEFMGVDADTHIPIRIRISDKSQDDSAALGRYELDIMSMLAPQPAFQALIDTMMQPPLLQNLNDFLPLSSPTQAYYSVNLIQGKAELYSIYQTSNAQQIGHDLITAYPDAYAEDRQQLVWDQSGLHLAVNLEDIQTGALAVLQSRMLQKPDHQRSNTNETLQSLGFNDFRAESAKCTLQNNQYGWLGISKDCWGENIHTAERNAITFMCNEHEAAIIVFYYPETQSYSITVENNGEQAQYRYFVKDNRYTDSFGGDDLQDARRITAQAFLAPHEEVDALSVAWSKLQDFVKDTLDSTPDELYALDYE